MHLKVIKFLYFYMASIEWAKSGFSSVENFVEKKLQNIAKRG